MKKDGKYPNCEMEFGIIESLNFILERKGLNTILQNELSSSERSFSKNFCQIFGQFWAPNFTFLENLPFSCCQKRFALKSNLKQHVKYDHENVQGYKCDSYKKIFGL